ncbi:MAG TPA: MFS transporter [Acidobacteriota bacterium]|nr:MFS transporter [Acidobacteriota bacterium]
MTDDNLLPKQLEQDVEVIVQTPRRAAPIPATRRIFSALTSFNYRLIFFGSLLSNIGTWIQRVAQSWLVLSLSNSAFYLGLDAFANDFPLLLFSLLGGVAADRMDRKRLLAWAQAAQLVLAGVLGIVTYAGSVRVWHIITISFLFGCVQAISVPTYLSFMPTLVQRQELPSALALNSMQFNVSRIVGPAIAGVLLLHGGAASCFLLNSISFLAVIISLTWMRHVQTRLHTHASVGRSLLQGAEYVRRHRILLYYLLSVFIFSFGASPLVTLLPLFARDILHAGAPGFSQLLSLFGTGAVIGALCVAGAADLRRKVDRVLVTISIFGLCTFAFALSRSLAMSSAIAFIAGASIIASNVMLNTMVQNESPGPLRGRIMSMYGLAFRGGMPLGNLMSGSIAQRWGGPSAVIVQGMILISYTGIFALFFRRRFQNARNMAANGRG